MLACFLAGIVLSVSASTPIDHGTTHEFLDGRVTVQIPPGYVLLGNAEADSDTIFVRRGDWAAALDNALPNNELDDLFLEDWFEDDIRDYVKITVVALKDRDDVNASPREFHERFARGFVSRWGDRTFSIFDNEAGVGRCGNYAGAFVFVAIRKLDDAMIVVEALDNVEALVAERGSFPEGQEPLADETLWKYFRRAANDETVSAILNSARLRE